MTSSKSEGPAHARNPRDFGIGSGIGRHERVDAIHVGRRCPFGARRRRATFGGRNPAASAQGLGARDGCEAKPPADRGCTAGDAYSATYSPTWPNIGATG